MWAQDAVQKEEAGREAAQEVMKEARTAVAAARRQNQPELATSAQWVSDHYVGHGLKQ